MKKNQKRDRLLGEAKQSFALIFQAFPLIFCGIMMSAAISALLPPDAIMKTLGTGAGGKSIFIGGAAGALIPGEPFFGLPIAEGLAKAGARYEALVAFIASWALFSVTLYPAEIAFLGWRFTLLRSAVNLFVPVLSGVLAYFIAL